MTINGQKPNDVDDCLLCGSNGTFKGDDYCENCGYKFTDSYGILNQVEEARRAGMIVCVHAPSGFFYAALPEDYDKTLVEVLYTQNRVFNNLRDRYRADQDAWEFPPTQMVIFQPLQTEIE